MPSMTPLNNANLNEAILPAAAYNALPFIKEADPNHREYVAAHSTLLNLISANKLSDVFSIHLIHKHFDCPNGQVMVYEPVEGGKTSDFIVLTPRDPSAVQGLRGIYFMATPNDKMTAYEYTTVPGADLSAYEDFAAQFAVAANDLGVADVFCLSALGLASDGNVQTEFEVPEFKSTIILHADDLPGLAEMDYVGTDWSPAKNDIAGEVPGITTMKCSKPDPGTGWHIEYRLDRDENPGFTGAVTHRCLKDKDGHTRIQGLEEVASESREAPVECPGKVGQAADPEFIGTCGVRCVKRRDGVHVLERGNHGEAALRAAGAVDGENPGFTGAVTHRCLKYSETRHARIEGLENVASDSGEERTSMTERAISAAGTVEDEVPGIITLKCVLWRAPGGGWQHRLPAPELSSAGAIDGEVSGVTTTLRGIKNSREQHKNLYDAEDTETGGLTKPCQCGIAKMSTGGGGPQSEAEQSAYQDIVGRAVAAIQGVPAC